jgi:two-component system response regulator HydG
LVVVNSARLSSGVEDSELFGHARGAFTGALQETSGLVAAAHRGTLFLDEIGELAPTSQAKMLRCLETGEVRRVGDTHAHEVDIRLIAATNRDLRREIEAGTFREDLYYRLAIITIYIPPLRERPEDIPLLADRFLRQIGEGMGREPRIAQAALDLLVRFPWPGNARQLDSCLRHAALLAGDAPIAEEHLPGELSKPIGSGGVGAPLSLAALERQHILEVLAQCGHDRQRAQRLLGISRATLQRRLTEYDIRA